MSAGTGRTSRPSTSSRQLELKTKQRDKSPRERDLVQCHRQAGYINGRSAPSAHSRLCPRSALRIGSGRRASCTEQTLTVCTTDGQRLGSGSAIPRCRRWIGYRQPMPRVSAFYGVVIYMYWNERDHPLAHFHAYHSGRRASVSLDGRVLAG